MFSPVLTYLGHSHVLFGIFVVESLMGNVGE